MKHKHYDMVVAWAGGAQIQARPVNDDSGIEHAWRNVSDPRWSEFAEYRIKPETIWVRLCQRRGTGAGETKFVRQSTTPSDENLGEGFRWISEWTEVQLTC